MQCSSAPASLIPRRSQCRLDRHDEVAGSLLAVLPPQPRIEIVLPSFQAIGSTAACRELRLTVENDFGITIRDLVEAIAKAYVRPLSFQPDA